MNTPDNYQFVRHVYMWFDSEIYMDINGKLYIKYQNNIFNSKGYIGLFKTYESSLYKLTDEQIESIEKYVKSLGVYETKAFLDILDKFDETIGKQLDIIFKLTNSVFIKQLSGRKVNLVKHNNGYKILLIIDEFSASNSSIDTIENIYVTLSKLGLTPYVHNHGRFSSYGINFLYLLTDYVPLTLKDVTDLKLKNDLLKRALTIIYAIRGMGYYNQDIHDENFLYDNINDKIYAIDFTDIILGNKYMDNSFYLTDLDRRVSFEEIINNVY